ncbi:50S ribosomal protein L4 [Candidatus Woesebacteria bacterium RBG_19FT_COMBO_47_8]|uniref:Large ribosomal subunit protein uL4 n=1 Tax=Candidatus Woesebacteria bacterium RBG_13_46_13 TaxID=1802479 RepID=A0A1F7X5J7_9BACT|nr:MAG: 50S ribosomal protein L4 [Candidatus Woesebacteria bacterium RBG_13_46_13]OGM16758.1 MAG: 50S ribosomal protein L4 [Candidatus Woesebacteria bacterium RBG_19FT_COMBO_47_8]HJX59166.1 50S ribosomal protein L4 [Patescibacteria group bacterium]
MLKVNTYSLKGTKLAPTVLPKEFETAGSLNLLAQAMRVYEARGHVGLAKTKTRAEVERTKKKWYRQKGTGGARHGAKSAPIFVGGGVAHGPRPIERKLSLPKRMAKKALYVALGLKAKDGAIVVADGLAKIKKTKDVQILIDRIKKGGNFTFALSQENIGVSQYLKNIKNAVAVPFKDLNAYKVFLAGVVVLDKDNFKKATTIAKKGKK